VVAALDDLGGADRARDTWPEALPRLIEIPRRRRRGLGLIAAAGVLGLAVAAVMWPEASHTVAPAAEPTEAAPAAAVAAVAPPPPATQPVVTALSPPPLRIDAPKEPATVRRRARRRTSAPAPVAKVPSAARARGAEVAAARPDPAPSPPPEPSAAPAPEPAPAPPEPPAVATLSTGPVDLTGTAGLTRPPERPVARIGETPVDARAVIDRLAVDGSLADAEVMRAVQRIQSRLADCHRSTAGRAGIRATAVDVRFTIDENGRARDVQTSGGSLPGLSSCIAAEFGAVRTRVAPDVGEVRVSLRVDFVPREAR
jgi:hypothetical protein